MDASSEKAGAAVYQDTLRHLQAAAMLSCVQPEICMEAATSIPAIAMRLPGHGVLKVGGPADFLLVRARNYSELLSRTQYDRVSLSTTETQGLKP